MATSKPEPTQEDAEDYYSSLEPMGLQPLWRLRTIPPEPKTQVQSHIWKWNDIYGQLLRAGEVMHLAGVQGEGPSERRALLLVNPGLKQYNSATNTLVAAVQLIFPGEIAPAHRHSAAAIRFLLQGHGAYTTVEGEKVFMERGDLILTPQWTWHDHGSESAEPVVWMDGLDRVLVQQLNATFFEAHPAGKQELTKLPGHTTATYGATNVRRAWEPLPAGPADSPQICYKWNDTVTALRRLAESGERNRFDEVAVAYVNPTTGGHILRTLGCAVQLLQPRSQTRAQRHTGSAICHVFSGEGTSIINGKPIAWEKGDFFVIPPWTWYEHANKSDTEAFLFHLNDLPVLQAFGLYREEAYEPNGDEITVDFSRSDAQRPGFVNSVYAPTVYLLNSGPAPAPYGASYLGGLHDKNNLLSVDMGGTSFDVCVIKDGEIPTTIDSWVGEHRVAIKMVDVPTVGAGGGSIAWIDSLGLLRVGPQSAGADPGPAAYGKGEDATVTDADLVLGYIPADDFLGGDMKLDVKRSHQAVSRVGSKLNMDASQTALVMYTTINTVMGNLITEVCTKKGNDVRDFTLVAGGGAGGIHAAAIARQLSIPMVIVPRVAALMSAFGMFAMDLCLEYARSLARRQNKLDFAEISKLYVDMRKQAHQDFARIGIAESQLAYKPTVEMRYVGQFHEVEIDLPGEDLNAENLKTVLQNFHSQYQKLFTYSNPSRAVEFLTYRLKVTSARRPVEMAVLSKTEQRVETARRGSRMCLFEGNTRPVETPAYDWDRMTPGHKVSGPALVDDKTTTVLVAPGFTCEVDAHHNLVMRAQ